MIHPIIQKVANITTTFTDIPYPRHTPPAHRMHSEFPRDKRKKKTPRNNTEAPKPISSRWKWERSTTQSYRFRSNSAIFFSTGARAGRVEAPKWRRRRRPTLARSRARLPRRRLPCKWVRFSRGEQKRKGKVQWLTFTTLTGRSGEIRRMRDIRPCRGLRCSIRWHAGERQIIAVFGYCSSLNWRLAKFPSCCLRAVYQSGYWTSKNVNLFPNVLESNI